MPGDSDDRVPLKGTDYLLADVPEWVPYPLRQWALDLTYDEAHAMLLGLVGTLAGIGWQAGMREVVAGITVALVATAFGLRAAPPSVPIAGRIVRREPWYFTTVYVACALLVVVV